MIKEQVYFKLSQDYKITINSKEEILELIQRSIENNQIFRIVTLNPEMLIYAEEDYAFKTAINSVKAIIPDGTGLVYLLKILGCKNITRVPGIEVAEEIIRISNENNYSVALIGASPEIIDKTKINLKNKYSYLNIIYSQHGYFEKTEEEKILAQILEKKPQVILMAMPFERSEKLLYRLSQRINFPCVLMGIGGSFDVWAGSIKRAPELFQKLGMEWFWRLINQPQRITRIYSMFWKYSLFCGKILLNLKSIE